MRFVTWRGLDSDGRTFPKGESCSDRPNCVNFTTMRGPLYLQIVDGLALLVFFVVDPFLFIAIGYGAWKGKPSGFNERKYTVCAIATFLSGSALILVAKLINADIRTWPYAVQAPCMIVGLLLIGVGSGCGGGFVVLYARARTRHKTLPE